MSGQQSPGKKRKLSHNFIQAVAIKVFVGPEEIAYTVVKQHICQVSDFFETACQDRWLGGQEGVVRLPEVDPVLFGIFATWVLHSIDLAKDLIVVKVDGISEKKITKLIRARFVQLIRLFVLGQFLQSEKFRNLVVDQLLEVLEISHSHPDDDRLLGTDHGNLKYIYQNTNSKSPLRQIILDNIHCQNFEHTDLAGDIINAVPADSRSSSGSNEYSNAWAKEFLRDLLNLTAQTNHATEYDRARSLIPPWDRSNSGLYYEDSDDDEDFRCT